MPDLKPTVLDKVRKALGRTEPLRIPPVPPVIDEPIVRLVHSDFGLPALFARTAEANKIHVTKVTPEELAPKLVEFLFNAGAKKVAYSACAMFDRLNVTESLKQHFNAPSWEEMTLDELFDVDITVTDAWCAVAETGSIVIRGTPQHGRSLSLLPPIHVAILEPKNFVPDLVDLFEKITREGAGSGTVVITGPSKTSDIEMTLVTGVHGPVQVHVFLLN